MAAPRSQVRSPIRVPACLGPPLQEGAAQISDKSDPVWQMVLLFRKIVQIITSPVILKSSLPKLNTMIRSYILQRITNFPNDPLRPKHHYFEHYPELILIHGPLMRSSTLGFETKHLFFKSTLRAKRCCKNITKTLANEH